MPARRSSPPVSTLHRGLGGLLAAVICLLVVLAVSPEAHAWVHGERTAVENPAGHSPFAFEPDDSGCAITLFAHGLTLPLALPRVTPSPNAWSETLVLFREELLLSPPRYRRQPGRAPPHLG